MLELLFAFAFWPWAMVLVVVVLLGMSAYSESIILGIVVMIGFCVIAWAAYGSGPLVWVATKPSSALVLIITYLAIGGLWSLFKWRRWVMSETVQYELRKAKGKFSESGDDGRFIDWFGFPRNATASYNKEKIVSWISLWPFSVFLYVFDDLLLGLFNRVYDLFAGVYAKITESYIPD